MALRVNLKNETMNEHQELVNQRRTTSKIKNNKISVL